MAATMHSPVGAGDPRLRNSGVPDDKILSCKISVHQPGSQLERLARAILRLFSQEQFPSQRLSLNTGRAIRAAIEQELMQRLEEGMRAMAESLRRETGLWRSASQELEHLSASRYLQSHDVIARLQEDLQLARAEASRIVEAFEALCARPHHQEVGEPKSTNRAEVERPRPVARRDGQSPLMMPAAPKRQETAPVPVMNGKADRRTVPVVGRAAPVKIERRRPGCLDVVCPGCAAAGKIPWDRLGHVLKCQSCSRLYRVHSNGRLVEVALGRQNRRTKAEQTQAAAGRSKSRKRLSWRMLSLALLLGLIGTGAVFLYPHDETPPPTELPRKLEARAELMGQAWLSKDLPLMRQLTASTHDRVLYSWLVHHPPPTPANKSGDRPVPAHAKITVVIVERGPGSAKVRLRIQPVTNSSPMPPLELSQDWTEREHVWYFLPSPH